MVATGAPIAGATGATLDLTTLSVAPGDTFAVEVTPSDSTLTGNTFTSGTALVGSISPIVIEVPTVTSVSIAPDDANAATTLTATPAGNRSRRRAATYAYQWTQDGTPIAGATGATLNLTTLTVAPGDAFAVEVTPSDTTLTGNVFTSGPVTSQAPIRRSSRCPPSRR